MLLVSLNSIPRCSHTIPSELQELLLPIKTLHKKKSCLHLKTHTCQLEVHVPTAYLLYYTHYIFYETQKTLKRSVLFPLLVSLSFQTF